MLIRLVLLGYQNKIGHRRTTRIFISKVQQSSSWVYFIIIPPGDGSVIIQFSECIMFCTEFLLYKQKQMFPVESPVNSKGLSCFSDKKVSSPLDSIPGRSEGPVCGWGSLRIWGWLSEGPNLLSLPIKADGFSVILNEILCRILSEGELCTHIQEELSCWESVAKQYHFAMFIVQSACSFFSRGMDWPYNQIFLWNKNC